MSSASSAGRQSSPTKSAATDSDVLKPNPHPYAIKTTSTGILSRSSSTSSSAHSHNHYVPISPSPSPTKQYFSDSFQRGSRHRYSRSLTEESSPRPLPVPQENLYSQYDRRSRARTGSFSEFEDGMNPKLWTYEQLAANVPEIADFVRENEITGRAFLRFDDGVLDAYGITQHWQRSLILDHCLKLKQSMLQNRDSNASSDCNVRRLSRSDSFSSYTSQHQSLLDEDDSAYLSSSSSISSTSSTSGHTKRRLRPNGRVHGLIVSYERSTSPDKTQLKRDRSGSTSSIEDGHHSFLPTYDGDNRGRPLPFPPQLAREYVSGPLLLPQASFPNSFPQFLNTPQSTGNSSQATPLQITRNDITGQITHSINHSRPLPATPLHPSLRPPPVLDEDLADDAAITSNNNSGEMTMDELIAVLDQDTEVTQPRTFVNIDRRNAQNKSEKRKKMGAIAWEMDTGETIKRMPPTPLPTVVKTQLNGGDDELTVEELLALEGEAGATALVNEPEGNVETMKRVGSNETEIRDRAGNGAECISLSAKLESRGCGYAKHQVRHVEELFSPEHGVDEAHGEEKQFGADTLELEHMQEIERCLLRAEKEERQQWEIRAAEVVQQQEARADDGSELSGQDERLQKAERFHKVCHLQCTVEHTQQLRQEPKVEEQRSKEPVAAEQQRQEDVEQRLASSIAENRRLLEEFRRRLERVEQRVEDLESSSAPSTLTTHENPKARVVQRLRILAAWVLSASLPTALGVPLSDFVRGHATTMSRLGDETSKTMDIRREKYRATATHHSKALPRYTLIFGLGICAFMLRGFLRFGLKGVRIGVTGAKGVKGR